MGLSYIVKWDLVRIFETEVLFNKSSVLFKFSRSQTQLFKWMLYYSFFIVQSLWKFTSSYRLRCLSREI